MAGQVSRTLLLVALLGVIGVALPQPCAAAAAVSAVPAAPVAVADFDGDGVLDVVRPSGLWVLVDTAVADRYVRGPRSPLVGLVAGDIDGDGDIDVAGLSADGWLHVWSNHGGQLARMQSCPGRSSQLQHRAKSRVDATDSIALHLLLGRSLSFLCPSNPATAVAPLTRPAVLPRDAGILAGAVALAPSRAPPVVS
jgi:hypothetical protein